MSSGISIMDGEWYELETKAVTVKVEGTDRSL